ncbi:hypothetical protein FOL47_008805 [Perkinsus chesapeaki]|uniref:Uncharacterized protein n=1 Tax=Perkinsus chesapeaki TaxID=330153 RepID=A0A7J6LC28_PERCH|nr:hypothetical protein FOL47_008805 [Perkinsus chesapeaki]
MAPSSPARWRGVILWPVLVIAAALTTLTIIPRFNLPLLPFKARLNSSSLSKKNALMVICFETPEDPAMLDGCKVTLASFRRTNPIDDIILIAPSLEHIASLGNLTRVLRISLELVGLGPYDCKVDESCSELPLFSSGYVHHYDYPSIPKFIGNALRHVWYEEVISRIGDSYDKILIADGKDLYFQADPFEITNRLGQTCLDKICLFSEPISDRVEKFFIKKTTNLSHCLPENERNLVIRDRRSGYANGGVILGMTSALGELSRSIVARANYCDFWQADQHYLNIIISSQGVNFYLFENGSAGLMAKTILSRWRSWPKSSGLWLQTAGALKEREPLSFIHQYQWDEDLRRLIHTDIDAWLRIKHEEKSY